MSRMEFTQEELDLARKLARKVKRIAGRHAELDDLESEAYLGLLDAKRRFQEGRGKFTTYGYTRIMGHLLDYLRSIGDKRRKYKWPLFLSLSRTLYQGTRDTFADQLADIQPPPEQQQQLRDLCAVALRCLNERERRIVVSRCCEELSMAQVGEQVGLSESRISQLMPGLLKSMYERIHHFAEEYQS